MPAAALPPLGSIGLGLLGGVESAGFVESPGRPLDADNDRVVDHSVDGGGGNHGVTEIIAELFEIDIGGDNCRPLAVAAIDDLVKETRIGGIMLLQAV